MFIGHFGVGFSCKAAAPRASLGTYFLAAQFIDMLWPTFLLLGIEHARIQPGITTVTPLDFTDYPFSHSLAAVVVWGALVGLIYQLIRHYPRGAVLIGLAVISHWVLDLVVHRPDLPLYPGGGAKVGLDLWSSLGATLFVEFALLGAGVWLYARATRARDRIGRFGLWGLVAFLAVAYLASVFGTPPPSIAAVAWIGQSGWLILIWAYWVDRHRIESGRVSVRTS